MRDAVEIWSGCFAEHVANHGLLRHLLCEEERSRASRFAREIDAQRYEIGRGLLRHLLGSYLDEYPAKIAIEAGPFGKPSIEGGLQFNLSHTGDVILYAFTRRSAVGVDVEHVDMAIDAVRLAQGTFATHEGIAIEGYDKREQPQAFFRCWTRKEALMKATGQGLSLRLADFTVSTSASAPRLIESRNPAIICSRWVLGDIDMGPDYAAAFAVTGPQSPVVRRRLLRELSLS